MNTDKFNYAEKLSDVAKIIVEIKDECKRVQSPLGYFAALYIHVAEAIEQKVHEKAFEDNDRLAAVDIAFVNLYIEAMNAAFAGRLAKPHWQIVIDASKSDQPLVLEYLLISMNAHIDYDLSAAAAKVVSKDEMIGFQTDFERINAILFSLLDKVQNDVANIFIPLKWYLKIGRKLDDNILKAVMSHIRDDAFANACLLALCTPEQWATFSEIKMQEVATLSTKLLNQKSSFIRTVLKWVSRNERGTVAQKIDKLLQ